MLKIVEDLEFLKEFSSLKRKVARLRKKGELQEVVSLTNKYRDESLSKDKYFGKVDTWATPILAECYFQLGQHAEAEQEFRALFSCKLSTSRQINFDKLEILNYIALGKLKRASYKLNYLILSYPETDISDILAAFKEKDFVPHHLRPPEEQQAIDLSSGLGNAEVSAINSIGKEELKAIPRLDDRSFRELMRFSSADDLILLIKYYGDQSFLQMTCDSLSKRAAPMLREDLDCDYDRPIPYAEYAEAIKRIIDAFRNLRQKGEIKMPLTPEQVAAIRDYDRSKYLRLLELDDENFAAVIEECDFEDRINFLVFMTGTAIEERFYSCMSPRTAEMYKEEIKLSPYEPHPLDYYLGCCDRIMDLAGKRGLTC